MRRKTVPDRIPQTLAEAFPSSPHRPPKFGLYCVNGEGHFTYRNFCAEYAAKRFIDVITENGEFKWLDCATILADNGVRISTAPVGVKSKPSDFKYFDLEKLIEYEYTIAELGWDIPEPYRSQWEAFPNSRPSTHVEEKREPRKHRDPGNVSVGTICEELELDPRKVRQALRKSGTPKPAVGWEWPTDQVDAIKALIRSNLK